MYILEFKFMYIKLNLIYLFPAFILLGELKIYLQISWLRPVSHFFSTNKVQNIK